MKKLTTTLLFFLTLSTCAMAEDQSPVNVKILAKSSKSWDGNRLPSYPDGQPEITILKITVAAGAKLAMHNHPVINAGILLKGQLTVTTTDNNVLHLHAGDSIVEVVNRWHSGQNEGKQTAEIIVFYAGIKGKPLTVKQ